MANVIALIALIASNVLLWVALVNLIGVVRKLTSKEDDHHDKP